MPRRLVDRVTRRVALPDDRDARASTLLDTEWLVTNGLGGYASSTMAGVITRRYHGILVAALPNPLGRMMMLNHLGESLTIGNKTTLLNAEEKVAGKIDPAVAMRVADVRLEAGLPVWEYEWQGLKLERRILMPHRQNTVHVSYRILEGPETATLQLRPAVHFRGYEDPVNTSRHAPSVKDYQMMSSAGVH